MRVMMFVRADKNSEAGVPPSAENLAAMGRVIEEMAKAGVLLGAEGLQPSSRGVRVKVAGGKRTVTDGPFTESKELVAGYALIQVKSLAEAIEWSVRFAEVQPDFESELRPLSEAADHAAAS